MDGEAVAQAAGQAAHSKELGCPQQHGGRPVPQRERPDLQHTVSLIACTERPRASQAELSGRLSSHRTRKPTLLLMSVMSVA